jgi:tRNA threonylcarbamoyladenosine biosynthesis protein TsaB
LVVAVDTSCAVETLALAQGDLVLAQWQVRRPKHRGAALAETLEALVQAAGRSLSDLAGAVVVVGPGAFTGLRVGIATLQGIASALDIALWPVEAMEGWAHAADRDLVGVTLDARRGEVYTALFRRTSTGLQCLLPLDLASPSAWARTLSEAGLDRPVELVGDGARLYWNVLQEAAGGAVELGSAGISGPNLAPAALEGVRKATGREPGDPRAIVPVYMRRHDGTRTP